MTTSTGWINYIAQTLNYYSDKLEEATGSRIYLMYITGLGFIFVGNLVYYILNENYKLELKRILIADKRSNISLDEVRKYELQINTLKKQNKDLVNELYKLSIKHSLIECENEKYNELKKNLNKENQKLYKIYNELKNKYNNLKKEYNYISCILRVKNGYITREK